MFRPRLAIEFSSTDDHFLAKKCRGYLVNIERRTVSGTWQSTEYCESGQLAWSARTNDSFEAADLPKDVPHLIDVLSTREIDPDRFTLAIKVLLLRYSELIRTPGTYRLHIVVSGDDVRPAWIKLQFNWNADWDDFEAMVDD